MNKSVTKYTLSYSSFHAEHDGDIYFYVKHYYPRLIRTYPKQNKIAKTQKITTLPKNEKQQQQQQQQNKQTNKTNSKKKVA